MQTTTITQVDVQPVAKPARPLAPIHVIEPRVATPHRADKWVLAIAAALVCVFAVAFVARVLQPAVATTSSSASEPWTADGP